MLSFNELQEKKSKIKINPKKDDVMEGSCGSYSKGGEVKKNHGEDCDCQKCEKKRRKEDLGDEKTVSTEELAYDSQEKVSEEGNQEIAETETKTLLTFDELQKVKKEEVEQVNEILGGVLKKVMSGGSAMSNPNQGSRSMAGRAGGSTMSSVMSKPLSSSGGTGGMSRPGSSGAPNASMAALKLSKGGKVKKKSYKESLEIFEKKKELSIDDQMRISREANAKRKPYKDGDHQKARAAQLKAAAKNAKKDTRTDAEKMTDATGPRPGSRYRGD